MRAITTLLLPGVVSNGKDHHDHKNHTRRRYQFQRKRYPPLQHLPRHRTGAQIQHKEEAEKMNEDKIVAFLRCPSRDVVDLAVELANLNWKEALAIDQCGRKAKTQERAAEDSKRSPDAMQRWYRAGIKKLSAAWAGLWWVEILADEALKIQNSKRTE